MDRAAFQRWLDAYVDAWRTYEEDAIGSLFADDAVYRYHPYDEGAEVVTGREAIVASWRGERDAPGAWSAEYTAWAVDGDRAVAVGVSRYLEAGGETVAREYHNVFLCRFDGEGRCREFTEYFMRRPGE